MASWVWEHFKKKDGKAVCQYEDRNGVVCGAPIDFQKTTSSMSYHLVHVHGLVKGAPAKKQRVLTGMQSVSSTGVSFFLCMCIRIYLLFVYEIFSRIISVCKH